MLTASLILSALTIISFLFLKYNKCYYKSMLSLGRDITLEDIVFTHIFFIIPVVNLMTAIVMLIILIVGILVLSVNAIIQFLLKPIKANHEH